MAITISIGVDTVVDISMDSTVSFIISTTITPTISNTGKVEMTSNDQNVPELYTSSNQTTTDNEEENMATTNDIELSIFGILWFLAILGNSLVCVVVYRSRRMQSTTNYFVVSLAVSDLLITVLCSPFIFLQLLQETWTLGPVLCKLSHYAQHSLLGATMFVLGCIAIDRFYTIIYPLSFKVTRETAKRMLIVNWILAFLVPLPDIYFSDILDSDGLCRAMVLRSVVGIIYASFLVALLFAIPTLTTLVAYVRVFRHIWEPGCSRNRIFQRTSNMVPRAKIKMLKLLTLVNAATILFVSPFFIAQLYNTFEKRKADSVRQYVIVSWVAMLSCNLKPLIYLAFNSNFRRGCKEVFCLSTMKCHRKNTYVITTASKFGKHNRVGLAFSNTLDSDVEGTKPFDRTTMAEKTMWPLETRPPNTYL